MSEHNQENPKPRIGYIGAGLMGHGAARNILEKGGYALNVIAHRNRQPIDDLVARGAIEAQSYAELIERSDMVFLCLPSSDVVSELMHAKDGLLAHIRAGMIVVDTTTSLPDITRAVAAELSARGAVLVDAPLGRSPKEAEQGRLGSFVGGDEATLTQVIPIIECYSENVIRTGPLGSAMAAKIVNTFISMANCAVIAEAVATATRLDVDLNVLYQIVSASGADSRMFQQIMPWALEGDSSGLQGHLKTAYKDISYYAKLADSANAVSFIGGPVLQLFRHAIVQGYGDHFTPVLSGIAAQLNGDTIREIKPPH